MEDSNNIQNLSTQDTPLNTIKDEKSNVLSIKNIGIATLDDSFNENQDNKLYKIREKSFDLKLKLNFLTKSQIDVSKLYIKKLTTQFQIDFPGLFVFPPHYIYTHIDLDSFYASCESLDNPHYKDIPLGVGSMNMLATCNYKAREYGIKAGMPGYMAKQICPMLHIVKCDFYKYNMYSEMVMEVLANFDKEIEIYGIDEACLIFDKEKFLNAARKINEIIEVSNISFVHKENKIKYELNNITTNKNSKNYEKLKINYNQQEEINLKKVDLVFNYKNMKKLINNIRYLVYKNTGLTVSAGISVTRGLAKFACGINKPNGIFTIDKDFDSHILDLETDKINGIGKATKEMLLKAYNIKYIRELRDNIHLLYLTLPYKTFLNLYYLSYGLSVFDQSSRRSKASNHSIGQSLSFRPTNVFHDICSVLWNLSSRLSNKLKCKNLKCGNISLSYKFSSFSSKSKQKKLKLFVNEDYEIFNECFSLLIQSKIFVKKNFDEFYTVISEIRLLGISCSDLVDFNKRYQISFNSVIYNHKICMICNKEYIHIDDKVFEVHVNKCLNEKEKELKNKKSKLDYFLIKIKK